MKKTFACLLPMAGLLLLAGCQKISSGGTDNGTIQFSARSSTAETRTAYSGKVDENNIERLDWLKHDQVRIYSDKALDRYFKDHHYADYQVVKVTPKGEKSEAVISNAPAVTNPLEVDNVNGLVWGEAGDYVFYGVYPVPTELDEQGHAGILEGSIPATQRLGVKQTPDMQQYAYMTAAQKVTTRVAEKGEKVVLDFTPAFTAFEFTLTADMPLTLKDFTLSSSGTGATALSGAFKVSYDANLVPKYSSTGTGGKIKVSFGEGGLQIDENKAQTFTVFALPQDLKNLTVSFTVRNEAWSADETRKLVLNDKNGKTVTFDACKKHRIIGKMQGSYNFKYITLEGEALEWEAVPVQEASDNLPQSSQFVVSDAKNGQNITGVKADRQIWVFQDHLPLNEPDGKLDPVTVSYKIFSPVGGTWELVPQGDVDKFTIMVNTGVKEDELIWTEVTGEGISGSIRNREDEATYGTTKVLFTIVPKNTSAANPEQARLWFKTYVYDGADKSGNQYSLDSETQLYDTRGYHYFQTYNPTH